MPDVRNEAATRPHSEEARASLSGKQLEALSQFMNPAFERGLWPNPMPRNERMEDEQPETE